MELSLIRSLIEDNDPLQTLYEVLTAEIWTSERFAEARRRDDLYQYLREGEHDVSKLEHELYDVYSDLYRLLEAGDPRRERVKTLPDEEQYTLLLIDGLSLRELPIIRKALDARDLIAETDFALAPLPTETRDFASHHFDASGPSDIVDRVRRYPFAFRHVTNEDWRPDFATGERQRFIWYVFPDEYFGMKETDYTRHVVQPVERILDAVLSDADLVRPLVITGDHGYIWQGNQCPWPVVDDRERCVLAEHFKLGRCTRNATDALAATGKAWVRGSAAAARGRFAWGGQVRGPTSLFKHGGVSFMECLVPWLQA